MTETVNRKDLHTSPAARQRVNRRYRAQIRLKLAGMAAIGFAALALLTLLYSVIQRALPAMTETYITLDINLDKAVIDPRGTGDSEVLYSANYSRVIKKALRKKFPGLRRSQKRELYRLISDNAAYELRDQIVADPSLIGKTISVDLLGDDTVDLFTKGRLGKVVNIPVQGSAQPAGTTAPGDEMTITVQPNSLDAGLDRIKQALAQRATVLRRQAENQHRAVLSMDAELKRVSDPTKRDRLQARKKAFRDKYNFLMKQINDLETRATQSQATETLDTTLPSLFVFINNGVLKVTRISAREMTGRVIIPLASTAAARPGNWKMQLVATPEDTRKISDNQIIWISQLEKQGRLKHTFNWRFFTSADASEPEEAGVLGGLLGTFWTMLVTFLLAFPIGVMTAVYLEEFAPENILTSLIEVSINNLAAIPSIVFGLLGLAVFVNIFGLPYSSSLVGGIVLALMTLPTVIIASRASIQAVPPSIRQAALAIGASNEQTIFQHVLPLAMPGIMTGSILGMAQALGETAPLLMIGMVAFIVEPPLALTDAAASLPVLIYLWADRAEVAFDMRTAAAILLLLSFLIIMNGLAIMLRKKFERRW